MPSSQELIERDLRMIIGDLQVQLIIVKAQLVELREQMSGIPSSNIPDAPNPMDQFMPKPDELQGRGNGADPIGQRPGGRPRMRPPVEHFDDSTS